MTYLETILYYLREPVCGGGSFRDALTDITNSLKKHRSSSLPHSHHFPHHHSCHENIDGNLPSAEDVFWAIAKVVDCWCTKFNLPNIKFDNNVVDIDELVNYVLPTLQQSENSPPTPTSTDGNSPYFYELNRALAPIDEEVAIIINTLLRGDYPRYLKYGVVMFLVDFIWWGWQTFLNEPEVKELGEITFIVSQPIGKNLLNFRMIMPQNSPVISLQSPNLFSNPHAPGISHCKILPLVNYHFQWQCNLFEGYYAPNKLIAFTMNVEEVEITDILLRLTNNSPPFDIVNYSCNHRTGTGLDPLGLVRAIFNRGNFEFNDTLINDLSPTGVSLSVMNGDSFAVAFKEMDVVQQSSSYSYSLEVYSGMKLIAQETLSASA